MNPMLDTVARGADRSLAETIRIACRRIPPLWSLQNFVAVNPFVGLSDRSFLDACQLIREVGHGDALMPAEYFLQQIDRGRIKEGDLQLALKLMKQTLAPERARQLKYSCLNDLKMELQRPDSVEAAAPVLSFADLVDSQMKTDWALFVVEEISKWCSAYYDQGQSSWRMPWRDRELFAAWKAAAEIDANPELNGLRQFRKSVAALPEDHAECVSLALERLGVPEAARADFLHRELMSIAGWSGYAQFLTRQEGIAGKDDALVQLLAVRLGYDLALLNHFDRDRSILAAWKKQSATLSKGSPGLSGDLLVRFVAQQALECGYQTELINKMRSQPAGRATGTKQKSLQAIFCIDVRSEVFRRSLEAQSDTIQTIGFAGFFGMPIEYLRFGQSTGGAHCPVLLTPKIKIRETPRAESPDREAALLRTLRLKQMIGEAWNSFKSSAISCFSFVETAGMWFGLRLAKDSLLLTTSESSFAGARGRHALGPRIEPEIHRDDRQGLDCETGLSLADKTALAAEALKNMGLTSNFARIVLVCGHGSDTKNNPYGSALDCGACGGHAGDANARVAAAILNQPEVRAGLRKHGIVIPTETLFLAGLHNTTTDEVSLYDEESAFDQHKTDLKQLNTWLSNASGKTRRERAESLGLADLPETELDESIFQRSRDWAQVRPEWGLAGNAAFIAAPRSRTRGLNLGGRTFLHDYDEARDPDKLVLTLIMSAPMIVASWINLQYYGSTVNNRLFGSGNKTIHNVLGTFGVWQGNGGDLQPGLPLQSVHDGSGWRHEPLRLNVFIEADRASIEGILAAQQGVRELVQNGWVNLFALLEGGRKISRYVGNSFQEELDHA